MIKPNEKRIRIAIDGPAASGKSTTAKIVAQRLGYLHIDTGAMYRAITLEVLQEKIEIHNKEQIVNLANLSRIQLIAGNENDRVLLNGEDVTYAIRSPQVTKNVSVISSYQEVRTILVREQRKIAEAGGVVLEGRDIGTVVLPQAELKIFMVANVAERTRRRKEQMSLEGIQADEVELAQEIEDRDRKDSTRNASPLLKAQDAIELDTSDLTIEQQVEFIVEKAKKIINNTVCE